jgi:hypothetical protein
MAYTINPSNQYYQHYSLSNCWGKPLILLECLNDRHETWYVCDMPSEAISAVYLINHPHQ